MKKRAKTPTPQVLIIGHGRQWRMARRKFRARIKKHLPGRNLPGYHRCMTDRLPPRVTHVVELAVLVRHRADPAIARAVRPIFGGEIAKHFATMEQAADKEQSLNAGVKGIGKGKPLRLEDMAAVAEERYVLHGTHNAGLGKVKASH